MDYTELVKALRQVANNSRYTSTDLLEDAADAIEQLQKSICPNYIRNVHDRGDDSLCDKYKCEVNALPKWIPVTERLPEQDGDYLVCGRWRGEPIKIWVCERVTLGPIMGWATPAENPAISHWMPLTMPTKEETE